MKVTLCLYFLLFGSGDVSEFSIPSFFKSGPPVSELFVSPAMVALRLFLWAKEALRFAKEKVPMEVVIRLPFLSYLYLLFGSCCSKTWFGWTCIVLKFFLSAMLLLLIYSESSLSNNSPSFVFDCNYPLVSYIFLPFFLSDIYWEPSSLICWLIETLFWSACGLSLTAETICYSLSSIPPVPDEFIWLIWWT